MNEFLWKINFTNYLVECRDLQDNLQNDEVNCFAF